MPSGWHVLRPGVLWWRNSKAVITAPMTFWRSVLAGRARKPDPVWAGRGPHYIPESPGLAEGAWKDTIVLPYNHPAAFDKIRRHASRLAGVIIEPVQGAAGTIPADHDFLSELRRITHETGAFLIFDEVITGFRLGPGGAQEYYGVIPDVSTFGKVAGGGLPFGAVGGTAEAMRLMEYDIGAGIHPHGRHVQRQPDGHRSRDRRPAALEQ